MNYARRIAPAFAPAILSSTRGGNHLALTPRRERTTKEVTS
jgi:hypothetical protein